MKLANYSILFGGVVIAIYAVLNFFEGKYISGAVLTFSAVLSVVAFIVGLKKLRRTGE